MNHEELERVISALSALRVPLQRGEYDLHRLAEEALVEAGLIKKTLDGVKILGGGELSKKLTVNVDKVTESAKEKIEAAGGKVEVK